MRSGARRARRLIWIGVALLGCVGPWHHGAPLEREEIQGPAPWTATALRDAGDEFSFAIVTDRTGDQRDGVFEAAVGKLNLLMPTFVLSVGDLIEGYSEDEAQITAEWDEFQELVDELEVPFFYAPGNHDYSNSLMARVWRQRFGPSYYHFLYRGVLFVVLNSELFSSVSNPGHPVEGPDTQSEQLAFVRHVLAEHRDARWTFVLLHQPLWDRPNPPADWLEVEKLLGDRPYSVFAGHFHAYTKQVRHDRRYITLATTGGTSRLRGKDRGEFDHLALVHMGADGPRIANLMLDGIADENVRTEAMRQAVGRLERALSYETILTPARGFRSGSVRFALRNEGKEPLKVEARFESGPDLIAPHESVSLRIEPGGTASVPVPVRAQRPLDLGSAAPAFAHWRLATSDDDATPVEIRREAWLLPEAHFECPRAALEVVVDGKLNEWSRLPYVGQARASLERQDELPAGGSFRFGVSYDDAFVYVAMDVTDPTPYLDPARSERMQDAISIVLDARPDPARSANESFFGAIASGSMAKLFTAVLVPGEAQLDPLLGKLLPPLPEGTQRAAQRSAKGYSAELAIPRTFLDARQGGPWNAFRLEVSQQDYDSLGREFVIHRWRPSRFGTSDAMPIPGSGTFVRAGTPRASAASRATAPPGNR